MSSFPLVSFSALCSIHLRFLRLNFSSEFGVYNLSVIPSLFLTLTHPHSLIDKRLNIVVAVDGIDSFVSPPVAWLCCGTQAKEPYRSLLVWHGEQMHHRQHIHAKYNVTQPPSRKLEKEKGFQLVNYSGENTHRVGTATTRRYRLTFGTGNQSGTSQNAGWYKISRFSKRLRSHWTQFDIWQ